VLDRSLLAPHALARWAAVTPDAIALEHVDGDRLTFAELHDDALRWAAALQAAGVAAGTHVATMVPNVFAAHRAMLALGWLRAVEVPLNTAYTGQMLRYALVHSDTTVLIVATEYLERVEAVAADLSGLLTVVVIDGPGHDLPGAGRVSGIAELLSGRGPAVGLTGPDPWDTACLLFTSGTTGASKAVVSPWGAVVYQMWSWVPADTVQAGEGLYSALPMFHNSGRSGFNYALTKGARFVFRDKFSATNVWDDVRRTGCVTLALVGPMTSLLWSAQPRPDDADTPVRNVVLGPMIPDMAAFERRFGVRVATCYGQTEIGVPVATGWEHGPWATCGRVREDYPWPEVRLVDEHDEPVPLGEVGEMVVRTREPWALNVGYYKMPEQTAAAWRNGWFHTGDAFRCDEDGWFYFVDRMNDAIRRRGENISSFEVENHLLEHPGVIECAAVGVRTPHGDEEVMAVIVAKDPDTFDPAELIEFLAPRMPRFMVPRYVRVVDDLPRNETTRRVRKHELRDEGVTDQTWDRDDWGIRV
jgi:crotonobetaine/carnitine-CoA ligase